MAQFRSHVQPEPITGLKRCVFIIGMRCFPFLQAGGVFLCCYFYVFIGILVIGRLEISMVTSLLCRITGRGKGAAQKK